METSIDKNSKIGQFESRDEEVRATISKEEAIRKIAELGGKYDDSMEGFDVYDQLLACEAISESYSSYTDSDNKTYTKDEGVLVNGNVIDSRKEKVNFELTQTKLLAISKIREQNHRTPPPEVASLLEIIFKDCETKSGWWLTVAQQWNPRAINRVLFRLIKLHSSGWTTFKNPAAYFTYLIKFRKKRRSLPISMMAVNDRR